MTTLFAYRKQTWRTLTAMAALAFAASFAAPAHAAAPTTVWVEGALTAAGGVPAADGKYAMTFALYAADKDGEATWSEGPTDVEVAGGRFVVALGATKAMEIDKIAALNQQWLGVKVGADPELPRKRLAAAPFALHAGVADKLACTACVGADQLANGGVAAAKVGFNFAGASTKGGPAVDLDCTNCVSVAELKFDGDVDLGGNSIKAKNGTFAGDVVAANVTAQAFAGDGSKLTGIKIPSGTCSKPGEVVKGIKADGTLECAGFAGSLPGDSIAQTSNSVVSNVFTDVYAAPTKDVNIPDNTGASATSDIKVPDLGLARDIKIKVKLSNSDLAGLSVTLLPPNDKAKGWTLCDPCGQTDAKALDTTWEIKNPPKTGKIEDWIGQNAQGSWTLKVLDASFCVPQKPGNNVLCDLTNKIDGKLIDWSIQIETLSSKKIHDPKGHVYARVVTAASDTLADGKALEVDTGDASPAVVAQAWVLDSNGTRWVQAATGVDVIGSCSACGSGKDGDYSAASSKNLSAGTYEFKSFTIAKGATVTVTGSAALVLKVQGKVDIQGTLLLAGGSGADTSPNSNGCSGNNGCAAGGTAGPGGAAGGQGCYSGNGSGGSGSGGGGGATYCSSYGVGGGGGGYGTAGDEGKIGSSSCQVGAAGGTYSGVHNGTLVGGSGGGGGSYGTAYNSGGGGGGGGGGVVRIDAAEIAVSGAINANGGRGGNNTGDCDGGGGGGGSGGGIWLRAGKVEIVGGLVTASGGAAGDAIEAQGSAGGDGGKGGEGQIRIDSVSAPVGGTSPAFKTGSATDLGTVLNKFALEQPTAGKVKLTNASGKTQAVRLVVTY